jgi:hypothetical protein
MGPPQKDTLILMHGSAASNGSRVSGGSAWQHGQSSNCATTLGDTFNFFKIPAFVSFLFFIETS